MCMIRSMRVRQIQDVLWTSWPAASPPGTAVEHFFGLQLKCKPNMTLSDSLDQPLTSMCPGLQVYCGAQEAFGLALCLPDLPARAAALLVALASQPVQGRHQGHRLQVGPAAEPASFCGECAMPGKQMAACPLQGVHKGQAAICFPARAYRHAAVSKRSPGAQGTPLHVAYLGDCL